MLKNCLETTQLENKIHRLEKNKIDKDCKIGKDSLLQKKTKKP